jgi:hypothetical protein
VRLPMAPNGKTMSIDWTPTLGLMAERQSLSLRPEPLHPLLERRSEARLRERLPCQLRSRGGSFSGVASQIGPGGLHVETDADLRPGETVFVTLESAAPAVPERGHVVYRRQAPLSLARVAPSGVGIQLDAPSALYRSFVESRGAGAEAVPGAQRR